MRPFLLHFFLLVFLANNDGQTVFTLVPTQAGDDLHFATDGYIYSSHYGGIFFRKINPVTGVVDTIFSANTPTIGAIEMDENLQIFTCSYDLGWVGKFEEGDNSISIITTGLMGPVGITHDSDGNLYVATNQNHSIIKILPDGTKETFVQGSPLFWPTGITIDTANNLYVANMFSGQIIKVSPEKTMTTLATLPSISDQTPDLAYLVWTHGKLYICHFDKHVIYEMNAETGSFQIIAGNGQPGHEDGPALEANFQNPTGIVASPSGDTLFITDGAAPIQRLRMLVLGNVSGSGERQAGFSFNGMFPTPTQDKTTFAFSLERPMKIGFHVVGADGKTPISVSEKLYAEGENQITVEVSELQQGVWFLVANYEGVLRSFSFVKS